MALDSALPAFLLHNLEQIIFPPLCFSFIILDQMKIINAFPVYFKGLGEQMEQMLEYPLEITLQTLRIHYRHITDTL